MGAVSTDLDRSISKQQSAAADIVDGGFALARFGQEASLAAVRDFVDQLDKLVPIQGADQSARRSLIDGAFVMADRVAAAQLATTRKLIHRPSVPVVNIALKAFAFEDVHVNVGVNVPSDLAGLRIN